MKMKWLVFRSILIGSTIIGCLADRGAAEAVSPRDMAAIKKFLRADAPPERPDHSARFWVSRIPGTDITLAYVESGYSCGSGGCDLMLLRRRGTSFYVEKSFGAIFRPITLLRTLRYGRPDLGVRGKYKFPQKPFDHQFPLRFDGWRYHEYQDVNLSIEGQPLKGRVLIAKNDPGVPLY